MIRLLVALLWASPALAAEYREITLTDGRTIVGEIVATEATGMRVRLPQGDTLVRFEDLVDMVPVDEAVYQAQGDLLVYVASDAVYRSGFVAAYRGVQGLVVVGEGDVVLSDEQRHAAALCDKDLECVVGALASADRWMWVVVGRMEGSNAVFEGATTRGATRTHTSAPRADVEALNAAALEAIQLAPSPIEEAVPEPVPEPVGKTPKERRPMTSDRATALAFVPVPGLPNAMAGDWTGFGIGMGVAVPATIVWVGATGKVSQSAAGHVALAVGGYYAATVVTNQVLASTRLRDEGVYVGVGPTRGGAAVTVTIAR